MQLRKIDDSLERRIAVGMIVSNDYIEQVQHIFDVKLLTVPYVKIVCDWCLSYYKQYNKSPEIHIQDVYQNHKEADLSPDMSDLVEEFLTSISHEYEHSKRFNIEYLVDQTKQYFKVRSMSSLSEKVKLFLDNGKVQEAENLISGYRNVEVPLDEGVYPFDDKKAIYEAFESREKIELFTMSGELGKFLNTFERDMFIGLMGPEKRGKSWWLLEFAMKAYKSKCNVAYIQAGDLSKNQIIRRIHTYNTGKHYKYEGELEVPHLDCLSNRDNSCDKEERKCRVSSKFDTDEKYSPCKYCYSKEPNLYKQTIFYEKRFIQKLLWREAYKLGKETVEILSGKRFRLSVHANRTVNVRGIQGVLDRWERDDGFVSDVIVVDYADVLLPEDSKRDFRQQQNDTWMALRTLSQERHCLVITATQSDAGSYSKRDLDESNFSEDKRKYSHVNMIITLNQDREEKRKGIMRLGKMFVRDDEYDTFEQVNVLQCIKIGRACLGSFKNKKLVKRYEEKEDNRGYKKNYKENSKKIE